MGLFDSLKSQAGSAINSAANAAVNSATRKKETFTFTTIPRSVDELKA